MKIEFDYFTVTAKSSNIRSFFFDLLKKTPRRFSLRSKFLKLGGPAYKGWAFQVESEEFFIGQRRSKNFEYEYIVTLPGRVCNLFIFSFFLNLNLVNNKWRITRLDLQLTLAYNFTIKNRLRNLYWNFYKNQSAKTKSRKVKFVSNTNYCLISVGSKKRRQNEWKVYSSELDGNYPKEVNVRFETTIKTLSQYLNCLAESNGCIQKCNFMIIQRTLLEAADTFLLSKHRLLVKDWSSYLKAQQESRCRGPSDAQRGPRGIISSGSRKSCFSEELSLVAESLQSFAKMVRLQRQTFSHKQVKFLNDQLNSQHWKISWNIRKEWAIIPTESNPLWPPLFAPLPQKGRAQAISKRQGALKTLATKFNKIILDCSKLTSRKIAYISEPKANKVLREIFDVVGKYPVMDKSSERLPRAQALYSTKFEDQTDLVKDIIRDRQREKNKR